MMTLFRLLLVLLAVGLPRGEDLSAAPTDDCVGSLNACSESDIAEWLDARTAPLRPRLRR